MKLYWMVLSMIDVHTAIEKIAIQKINAALVAVNSVSFRYSIGGEGPRLLSLRFNDRIRGDISTGKWVGSWSGRAQRYSPKYRNWKEMYARGGQFGVLFGDLVMNITNFKVGGSSWMSGVPDGVMDRGGKSWLGHGDRGKPKSIAMYGKIFEEGYSGDTRAGFHPKRPVFRHTLDTFARETVEEGKKILVIVGDSWR